MLYTAALGLVLGACSKEEVNNDIVEDIVVKEVCVSTLTNKYKNTIFSKANGGVWYKSDMNVFVVNNSQEHYVVKNQYDFTSINTCLDKTVLNTTTIIESRYIDPQWQISLDANSFITSSYTDIEDDRDVNIGGYDFYRVVLNENKITLFSETQENDVRIDLFFYPEQERKLNYLIFLIHNGETGERRELDNGLFNVEDYESHITLLSDVVSLIEDNLTTKF